MLEQHRTCTHWGLASWTVPIRCPSLVKTSKPALTWLKSVTAPWLVRLALDEGWPAIAEVLSAELEPVGGLVTFVVRAPDGTSSVPHCSIIVSASAPRLSVQTTTRSFPSRTFRSYQSACSRRTPMHARAAARLGWAWPGNSRSIQFATVPAT